MHLQIPAGLSNVGNRRNAQYCGTWFKPRGLEKGGGRDIRFEWSASNARIPGSPPIQHHIWIWEDPLGNATIVQSSLTEYLSLELWQYADDGERRLIYNYDAALLHGKTPFRLFAMGSVNE